MQTAQNTNKSEVGSGTGFVMYCRPIISMTEDRLQAEARPELFNQCSRAFQSMQHLSDQGFSTFSESWNPCYIFTNVMKPHHLIIIRTALSLVSRIKMLAQGFSNWGNLGKIWGLPVSRTGTSKFSENSPCLFVA